MITINADKLSDGLYQIQDGQIHKYKAKGGTVRTYEIGEIVRCEDCQYWHSNTEFCDVWSCLNVAQRTLNRDYCSRGKRREESEVEE